MCILAGLRDHLLGQVPDRLLREHLAVPVVLADHEQDVPRPEVRPLVDVGLDTVEREAAHGRVEVDDPERDADDRPDRQPDLVAGALDLLALLVGQVERVLEDVVRVEADLLGRADAVEPSDLRVQPGRADHPEFHRSPPSPTNGAAGDPGRAARVSLPERDAALNREITDAMPAASLLPRQARAGRPADAAPPAAPPPQPPRFRGCRRTVVIPDATPRGSRRRRPGRRPSPPRRSPAGSAHRARREPSASRPRRSPAPGCPATR